MSRARSILEQLEIVSNGLRVSVNPTNLKRLLQDIQLPPEQQHGECIRFLGHLETCDVFAWNAWEETHKEAAAKIGVDYNNCVLGWAENRSGKAWDAIGKAEGWTLQVETRSAAHGDVQSHHNWSYIKSKMEKALT